MYVQMKRGSTCWRRPQLDPHTVRNMHQSSDTLLTKQSKILIGFLLDRFYCLTAFQDAWCLVERVSLPACLVAFPGLLVNASGAYCLPGCRSASAVLRASLRRFLLADLAKPQSKNPIAACCLTAYCLTAFQAWRPDMVNKTLPLTINKKLN